MPLRPATESGRKEHKALSQTNRRLPGASETKSWKLWGLQETLRSLRSGRPQLAEETLSGLVGGAAAGRQSIPCPPQPSPTAAALLCRNSVLLSLSGHGGAVGQHDLRHRGHSLQRSNEWSTRGSACNSSSAGPTSSCWLS